MNPKIFEILAHSCFFGLIGAIVVFYLWPSDVKKFIKSFWNETPTEIISTPSPIHSP
ncbi:hypothetical protein PN499_11290 [Kamptonema animale CS-326]|jgi:hypothetical protein|uniref:hypothetical protein n=1 Tax=Kamptonema animale TaxID=92934 RepID=UPI0023303E9C|nr:hypothetical protein [Kamptonema animale]MDB9511770.1 hypothetical protein [Kamptonema animale CS-326]